jgi:acetyl esterase/lipase
MSGAATGLEQQIRERGAVLDLRFAQALYKPLLAGQPREDVEVVRDLPYGEDARNRLDVYHPRAGSGTARAVLVFFHGGGFIRGDKGDRDNVGFYFARRGCVVVVANYRLAPAHTWPAGAEDVVAAYAWTHRHIAGFGGDRQRIFLAGESAGAAHVAAATLVRRFHAVELEIAGAMLISGVYNVHLEGLARQQFGVATPDPRNEPYFGSDFARYPAMSTVALIDAPPAAPLLITYAELDMPQMQVQAGELFARLVVEHGWQPHLKVIPGHNHLTQLYAINTGDEALSSVMLDFMGGARAVDATR